MNEQAQTVKQGFRLALTIVGSLIGIFAVATLSWPWILNIIENGFHIHFQPEAEIRACIWWGFLLFLGALLLARRLTGRTLFTRLAWVNVFVLAIEAPMFLFDPTHLKDELAWVRYPTAFFLVVAAVGMWLVSRRFNRGERLPKPQEWIWFLFAAGFLYAAADEIMQIHEIVGNFVERVTGLPHTFTDLLTFSYGIIGIVVLLYTFKVLRPVWHEMPKLFFMFLFAGLTIFLLSAFFDTFDVIFWRGLDRIVHYAYDGGMKALPDLFTFWYAPNLVLNGFEEVFEMTAAIFFTLTTVSFFRDLEGARHEVAPAAKKHAWTVAAFVVAALIIPSVLTTPIFTASSPFVDGMPATALAARKQGLNHADDLSYDEKLGLIVANESRADYQHRINGPGVFRYRDGVLERLPDPEDFLIDTDSVSIMDGRIYASDPATGFVHVFDEGTQSFQRVAGREQGLKFPEGMAPFDDTLYVVDERSESIATVTKDGAVTLDLIDRPDFRGPEDIQYVPKLKAFLVTDDCTGIIFQYVPGSGALTVWADKSDGLGHPESLALEDDDHILVTDNGTGDIHEFDLSGDRTNSWHLRFLYGDGQGIAIDEKGNASFITSDAFEGVSFMPSVLWTTQLQ